MIRALFLLILILQSIVPLPAAAYRANSIGQLVEAIPSITGVGYEAESDGTELILYSNGSVVRRTIQDGNSKIVEEGSTTTTTLYDDQGNILSERINDGLSEIVKNYEYTENGILNRVIESSNGEVDRIITYLYDPSSQLAAIYYDSPEGAISYVSTFSFTYASDGIPVRVREYPGLLIREEYGEDQSARSVVRNEDGSVTVAEPSGAGRMESTYTSEGLLASRRIYDAEGNASSSEEYIYSNGLLASSSVTEGANRTDSSYSLGVLLSEDRYEDDVLRSHREYSHDRSFIETVYRNDRPYANVGYDADGIRVLSLEVL